MTPQKRRSARPTPERFWEKVNLLGEGGCWMWTAATTPSGYGYFGGSARPTSSMMQVSHRYSYELLVGPVPEGLQLDHLCRNRACVNPDHLEPVTPRTNVLRGVGPSAHNARKTHCIRGHEFTPENTYVRASNRNGQPQRSCRECMRMKERKRIRVRKPLVREDAA